MLFSNQRNLTFSNFLEPLNQYNCSRIGLLGQGHERTSQDETLTYQTFQIQMTLIKFKLIEHYFDLKTT
jgi:hypothetical protein